jgi:predicted esterase
MKGFNRSTRSAGASWFPRRRCSHPLQAVMLSILLLGLSMGVVSAAQVSSSSTSHVYLLRGAFNVFSLGMDQIAARLQRQGISTTVANYLSWPALAEQAAAEYKSGHVRSIILVGHSSGAVAVTSMATRLDELGVPVKLAIGLDPTSHATASGHVERYVNYYIANGFGDPVDRGQNFSGVLQNVDVEHMPDVGHFNIEKNRMLQDIVIRDIHAALSTAPQHDTGPCDAYGRQPCSSMKKSLVTGSTPPGR